MLFVKGNASRKRQGPGPSAKSSTLPEPLKTQLSPDDIPNFLHLCMALKSWLHHELTEELIVEGSEHLAKYLDGLKDVIISPISPSADCTQLMRSFFQLYGAHVLKPNHHWSIHTASFLRDYGPIYGFWTFLFERLNKVLKSFRSNNHGGGQLECTFFREFLRTSQVSRLVSNSLKCA